VRRTTSRLANAKFPVTEHRVSLLIAGIPAPKGSRIPGHRKDGSIFTRPANPSEKSWAEAVAYSAKANRPSGKTGDGLLHAAG
jgi:hypothetical protein